MDLIKSIAAIATIFAILSPLASADLASARLSEKELAKLSSSVVKFVKYNRHLIDDLGYAGIKAISFEQTKKEMSLSAIIKHKKKNAKADSYYSAVISDDHGSANLFFRNYRDCIPTEPRGLVERSVYIDGQKVSTNYGCVKAGVDDNTNTEVYLIKTAAGKKFAYDSFANNNFTFVKFDEMEIPFDTTGFLGVWEEANKPAL